VGEKLRLDDPAYTIIGVASAKTVLLAESVQVWLPLVTDAMSEARPSRSLGVWGLLKPGVPTENFLGDDDALVELLQHANLTDQNQIVDW
jgi:hypothetical protein